MSHHNRHTPIWGIVLVVIGLILFLGTLDIMRFHWSLILIIIGAVFFVFAFSSADRGSVFPGTILLLIGLFYFLRYYDILDHHMYYMWPVFPVIVGAAFLILFIFRPADWGLLIPAGILLLIGLVFLAYNYDFFDYNPVWLIHRYWPLILIVIGAKLLLAGRRKG